MMSHQHADQWQQFRNIWLLLSESCTIMKRSIIWLPFASFCWPPHWLCLWDAGRECHNSLFFLLLGWPMECLPLSWGKGNKGSSGSWGILYPCPHILESPQEPPPSNEGVSIISSIYYLISSIFCTVLCFSPLKCLTAPFYGTASLTGFTFFQ